MIVSNSTSFERCQRLSLDQFQRTLYQNILARKYLLVSGTGTVVPFACLFFQEICHPHIIGRVIEGPTAILHKRLFRRKCSMLFLKSKYNYCQSFNFFNVTICNFSMVRDSDNSCVGGNTVCKINKKVKRFGSIKKNLKLFTHDKVCKT